jgi:hypothetical protein
MKTTLLVTRLATSRLGLPAHALSLLFTLERDKTLEKVTAEYPETVIFLIHFEGDMRPWT